MSKFLIEERPLTVLPTLVKHLGFERAVLLQQIHWLVNQPHSGIVMDDEKWVYGTYEEWCKDYFSFWEPRTLRHHVAKLEEQGLLVSCQPKAKQRDMTKYYRIDYVKLDEVTGESSPAQNVTSMWQRVATSNRQPIDASMRQRDDACYIEQRLHTETSTETTTTGSGASSGRSLPEKDALIAEVYSTWQNNMPGTMSPIIADSIDDLIKTYGPVEVKSAIEVAVKSGVRKISYVDGILRNRANGNDFVSRSSEKTKDGLSILSQSGSGKIVQGDISMLNRRDG